MKNSVNYLKNSYPTEPSYHWFTQSTVVVFQEQSKLKPEISVERHVYFYIWSSKKENKLFEKSKNSHELEFFVIVIFLLFLQQWTCKKESDPNMSTASAQVASTQLEYLFCAPHCRWEVSPLALGLSHLESMGKEGI